MPYEGQTGTAPDGTRVVYRGGKIVPVGQERAPTPNAQDAAYLNDLRTQASSALNVATQAERFMGINKKHGTGGGVALPGMSNVLAGTMAPYGEMESITSKVAPAMRPPGSGSSSDKDTAMYRRGFPNIDFPGDANANIAKGLQDQSDLAAAHAAFLDSWYSHKGTLLGGEQAFSQYWSKKSGSKSDGTEISLPGGGTAVVKAR